jgi:hypothetical protein
MKSEIYPNHVAILVPSVRRAAKYLAQCGYQVGKEEEWEGEGTKEIYVEREKSNSLLLMEPIKAGAYQRAMDKRGPGLHHLAIDVQDLESYIESLAGTGWLLHPLSIKTMKKTQTAYLARPGFPCLIEVQEKDELIEQPLFIDKISLPLESNLVGLIKYIGLDDIVVPSSTGFELFVNGKGANMKDLL